MNKEELIKMFDEMSDRLSYEDFKAYVFETIIKEVLSSMLVYEGSGTAPIIQKRKYSNKVIKQKAKESFGIEL